MPPGQGVDLKPTHVPNDTRRTAPSTPASCGGPSAPDLLAKLAREAEKTSATPAIDKTEADILDAAVHDAKARLRAKLKPSSSRCEDPHRLMLSNGQAGMVVPRLCGNVRCPACGIWRRACAVLTVQG